METTKPATRWLLAVLLVTAGLLTNVAGAAAAPKNLGGPVGDSGMTFRVYAHREGLVGQTTANGHVIQERDRFVALPCRCVLASKGGQEFQVKIEYKGRTAIAPVWDVGPWNINDNYWDPPEDRTYAGIARGVPAAAAAFFNGYNNGRDFKEREVRSPAGIDIGDGTFWDDLGMIDSDWVDVTFLWLKPKEVPLPPLPAGFEDVATVRFGQRPPLDWTGPRDDAKEQYFPETGHNVRREIVDYWYANGGWRNIGLPITELFREVGADGRIRFVQYFERQILQLNPPPSDLPLVQSDLIGYSAWAPPASRAQVAPFASSDTHWFFPETSHSLGNGFLREWLDHGGVPTFGYPITEEFSGTTPDGRAYVAQIFERARFEWWPDRAGSPGEITYGLLVSDLLRQAGWVE